MGLVLVTPPAVEPITLDELEAQLHIEGAEAAADAATLERNRIAARKRFEGRTSRSLIDTTWDYVVDGFPEGSDHLDNVLELPRAPLRSVTSVTYLDTAGASKVLPASDYVVDTTREPGRIYPAHGKVWPSTLDRLDTVTVRFVAGYGAAAPSVPEDVRMAILATAAAWSIFRESITDERLLPVPMGAGAVIQAYRWEVYAR